MKRGSCFLFMLLTILIASPVSADSPTTHTVAWGETLYSIARVYGIAPQAIASANGISVDSWVYAGTRLTIPSSIAPVASATTPSGYYTVRAGDGLSSIAAQFGTTAEAIAAANNLPANGSLYVGWSLKIPSASAAPQLSNPPTNQTANTSTTLTHIVQPGEYLALIALKYGTTAQAIAYANNLRVEWGVYVGQRLTILTAQARPTAAPAAATDARASNVPLLQQKQTLTCEEASASMASRGAITEVQLVAVMPRSDNPFTGIRGHTNSPYYGGLSDYGVYAQGLQKGLSALNIKSQVLYGQTFDDFKNAIVAHLRAGRPVVWWHTWQDSYQAPVMVRMAEGSAVKLVPYEHAGVIVAASDRGVTYHDPYDATVRFISWEGFRRVSGYFDNMALVIQ